MWVDDWRRAAAVAYSLTVPPTALGLGGVIAGGAAFVVSLLLFTCVLVINHQVGAAGTLSFQ